MKAILPYLYAFLVGGTLCLVGQVLIDRTKLTPARILSGYVVAGVLLGALGLYQPLIDFAGAGAAVPLTGFGSLLARGVREAVADRQRRSPRAAPAGFGCAETLRRPALHPQKSFQFCVLFTRKRYGI